MLQYTRVGLLDVLSAHEWVLLCRYLAEGVLPTTNEISVLKFAEQGTSSNGSGSSSDDEGVTMKVCVACG